MIPDAPSSQQSPLNDAPETSGSLIRVKKKRIGILTGGGDVPPLNAVIAAAQHYCQEHELELIGFLKGWEGPLNKQFVSLSRIKINPGLGGTILKSSRINLAKIRDASNLVKANLKEIGVEGLIVIGGEDTLSNSFILGDYPQVLISKTIDNDVGIMPCSRNKVQFQRITNYFTLGYPSAADKISKYVSLAHGLGTTAYSHERIIVVESMGMHAGWLALASSMGNPDFIVVPEFPIDYEVLQDAIARKYKQQKHVMIVIAEGSRWKSGQYVSADKSEMDSFGHPRFKGSAAVLAEMLKRDLAHSFDTRNVNYVNPSYLYRSGPPVKLDLLLAQKLGKKAAQLLSNGIEEPVFLSVQKAGKSFSPTALPIGKMKSIEAMHRFVDKTFYSPVDFAATGEARRYLANIVPEVEPLEYGLESNGNNS